MTIVKLIKSASRIKRWQHADERDAMKRATALHELHRPHCSYREARDEDDNLVLEIDATEFYR